MSGNKMVLLDEEVRILKVAKKKRRVNGRDFNWWVLLDMVKKGALSKVNPRGGSGWPHFVISPRGKKYLKSLNVVR
jgi:hypothetical protein